MDRIYRGLVGFLAGVTVSLIIFVVMWELSRLLEITRG